MDLCPQHCSLLHPFPSCLSRVLQLMNLTDSRLAQAGNEKLELAMLSFFEQFRKIYIGDQVQKSSKVKSACSGSLLVTEFFIMFSRSALSKLFICRLFLVSVGLQGLVTMVCRTDFLTFCQPLWLPPSEAKWHCDPYRNLAQG